jgi:phosphoglycolate phosphatase
MPRIVINGTELNFRLALFDLDGTLVDDEDRYKSLAALRFAAIVRRAGSRAADTWASLGGYDPVQRSLDMSGPIAKASRREDMAIAAAAIYTSCRNWQEARTLADAAYTEADTIQIKRYTPIIYPGVEVSLQRIKSAGFVLGIVTNGLSRITEEMLTLLKIRRIFTVVVGSEDAPNPKPAPDLILTACKKARIPPSDTVYIGDQSIDAAAAEAAGCRATVIVGKAEFSLSPRVYRVDSVAAIDAHP